MQSIIVSKPYINIKRPFPMIPHYIYMVSYPLGEGQQRSEKKFQSTVIAGLDQ